MLLTIFLISAAVAILCAAAAKKYKKHLPVLITICLLCACTAVPAGLMLTGHGGILSYPGNPKATATHFFSALRRSDFGEADGLLLGADIFGEDTLSQDTAALLPVLCRVQKAEPVGDPVYHDFTAVQTLRVTLSSPQDLQEELYESAYDALFHMMAELPRSQLLTENGKDYLPEVRETAWSAALKQAAAVGSARSYALHLDVELQWTPIGWYVRPTQSLLNTAFGCDDLQALDATVAEMRTAVLEELPVLKKMQLMDKTDTVAPMPNADAFIVTDDPMVVAEIVAEAAPLLRGQSLCWSPDLELVPNSKIRCYRDDSILVIIWQEVLDNCVVTFSEVKITDPAQMYRTFCQDEYMSAKNDKKYEKPSTMAQRTNAVVGVTGDFYRYRNIGTVVYQGELYRLDPRYLDSCFFDEDGNMCFVQRNTTDKESLAEYISENDFQFSISFGPVLIRDGQKQKLGYYPIGESFGKYDRCAFGQLDELHYLFLTANYTTKYNTPATLPQAQTFLYDKGCVQGYALDGGQTGAIIFDGKLVNRVNYGGERFSSDMICFATAVDDQ